VAVGKTARTSLGFSALLLLAIAGLAALQGRRSGPASRS